jgi:uncharacterized damage-inducible protein DinB
MQALHLLRIQAHANHMANLRLQGALAGLSAAEFQAPRTGFFPSLQATLDHIVAVDAYYVGALHGDAGLAEAWQTRVPKRTLADWHAAQQAVDQRLIAWLLAADDAALDAPVHMPRGNGRVQTDAAAHMLQHLFRCPPSRHSTSPSSTRVPRSSRPAHAQMRQLVDDLNAKLAQIAQGGGEAARAKHTARGKLLPRERVEMLLDPDTPFLESRRWRRWTCTTTPRPAPA